MSAQTHFIAGLLNATSKIAVRLRLVFILVGLATAMAGFIAIMQTRTILVAHSELKYTALPMLTLAQRTERDMHAMFLVLENINSFDNQEALAKLREDIKNKTERVRQNLNALQNFDASASAIADLNKRLSEAQASSLKVLEHQANLFILKDQVARSLARIMEIHEKSQHVLDRLSLDISGKIDALIHTPAPDNQNASQIKYDQIDTLFNASYNLSSFTHGLDSVVSLTNNQNTIGHSNSSDRARLLVNSKIQSMTNRLILMPDGPARYALARYLSEIRDLLADDGDFFARLKLQHQFQQEFNANRATHLPLMLEISDMSAALVNRTLDGVKAASERLQTAVNHLIWVLAGAFIMALITIILTNHGVVERQFTRRIKDLNASVMAIAGGDLQHPITISGPDELGDMARALVVFKETAEELRRSNIELEKFAYVAAHDLRSPLRAIHDLSEWTIEDDENVLSNDSKSYLALLQGRVDRLNKLLNDLLAYARIGQDEPEPEHIDLAALVEEQAHYADPENHYNICYDGAPVHVFTQRTPLLQIISNLLNNAVKHHDRTHGHITVTCDTSGRSMALIFSDDGPGIELQYQSKIFELFQTLRPRDEVEGSGLGLAIVKKIITRRKGAIDLISDPSVSRGATFEVRLPLAQPAQIINKQSTKAAA